MKKILIGSLLALGLVVAGGGVAMASGADHSFSEMKVELTSTQDKASDIWTRLNAVMDRAEAEGIDISNAEALHDETLAEYNAVSADISTLKSMIDGGADVADLRAEVVILKGDFNAWKADMSQIVAHLRTAYENHIGA